MVGGNNANGMTSTQCYDFDTGAWNAENADMGALPADLWGMGYAVKRHAGTEPQLWLTGGVRAGALSTATDYYDVNSGTWQPGGDLIGGAVYRTAAVTLNNESTTWAVDRQFYLHRLATGTYSAQSARTCGKSISTACRGHHRWRSPARHRTRSRLWRSCT